MKPFLVTHKKNALEFIDFLCENEMIAGGYHGEVSYQNNTMCYINFGSDLEMPDPWTIYIEGDYNTIYDDTSIDWQTKVIVGCNAELAFYIPDTKEIGCIQKLLGMRKCEILKKSKM